MIATARKSQDVRQRLQIVEQEFSEFTYRVSHDLGAPLRAIVNFSRLLTEKYSEELDEKSRRYLEFICKGGEKAQAMLEALAVYSRINTKAQSFFPVPTGEIVEASRNALKDKITERRADVQILSPLPVAMADYDQCMTLFTALIDNAITYHTPGAVPEIRIYAQEQAHAWQFHIEDNGIGIDASQTERIFQIFKRLHTDEEYPGIGIGLTLAKKIVERHGGQIGIGTAPNGNTLCWFTLLKPPVLPMISIHGESHG